MNVLVTLHDIVNKSNPGGVGSYYKSLRPHLGSTIEYFAIGKRSNGEGKLGNMRRLLTDPIRFSKALSAQEVGLVQVNPSLVWRPIFRDGLSVILAKRKGKRVVVYFRGWDKTVAERITARWRTWFMKVLNRADGIIVLSQGFADQIRSWGYPGPVFVETTTVDDRLLEIEGGPVFERCKSKIRILFLARIEEEKGIFTTLDAFDLLRQQVGRSVELVVAGDGSARKAAEDYARRKGLNEVRFTGDIRGPEKAAIFRESDVYVFPSRHGEGMPNSVLEAMAFGLPVISSAVGGLPDFFQNQKMGAMMGDPDSCSIARALHTFVEDDDRRSQAGMFNEAFAKRYFLSSVVAARLHRIWATISSGEAGEMKTYSWFAGENSPAGGEEPAAVRMRD